MLLSLSQCVGKSLIMNDFTLTQEFYRITDVGIVAKTENVVVSRSRLLFCGKIFIKVGYGIAFYPNVFHIKRRSRCRNRIKAESMVHKISFKRAALYFVYREISCKLMKYCSNYFKMCKLFSTVLLSFIVTLV